VSGGFSVTIDDLAVSAHTFSRLHTDAVAALDTAAAGLAPHAGMAGDDPVLAGWRDLFDRLATAVWAVHATAAATFADIADKLVATGNGYLDADAASGGDPGDRIPSAPAPDPSPEPPPSSTGPLGPAVPTELAAYWPGGDPDALRTAGAVWSGLADRADATARSADAAFSSLTGANSGATFSAIAAYWERHYQWCATDPLFNVTSACAQQLGLACVALAAAIEASREEMGRAALEASEDLAHVELPAHLLGRFTRGATVAILEVGKAALATKLLDGYRYFYLEDVDRLVAELRCIDLAHLHGLAARPPPQPAVEVGLQDVGEVLGLGLTGSAWDDVDGPEDIHVPGPDEVHLTEDRRAYILDGDGRGGGHGAGRGAAGKSEFPAVWSDDRALTAVMAAARAPDRIEFNTESGNWNIEKRVDGLLIKVAVDRYGTIVTAYPLEGPGIVHNP
jgi:hypothetical protein